MFGHCGPLWLSPFLRWGARYSFEQGESNSRVFQNDFIICPKLADKLKNSPIFNYTITSRWIFPGQAFPSFLSLENSLLACLDECEGPTFIFKILGFYIVFFLQKTRNITINILSQITVFHLADHWHVIGKLALTKMTLFPGYWKLITFLLLITQYLQV